MKKNSHPVLKHYLLIIFLAFLFSAVALLISYKKAVAPSPQKTQESDEITDIEADLEVLDLSELDKELNEIEAEFPY